MKIEANYLERNITVNETMWEKNDDGMKEKTIAIYSKLTYRNVLDAMVFDLLN